ncbi:hypothetical protein IE077_000763 [Cardiosporidium cionae]|uniref:Dehydrogenase/reductase 4 n=1 Tax=Cardiosporidium cionae TaxID=476202 RepID=A0ABQ7JDY1_9APIC|nr:hypothetical protein IE077_000763 [Cardiosporidium cionae]|eukprot:KAF8822231.1 hypothetical protein IE077_000763 [Cardiosporidium cionae]
MAIALAYANEAADLILCSRSKEGLEAVARECMQKNAKKRSSHKAFLKKYFYGRVTAIGLENCKHETPLYTLSIHAEMKNSNLSGSIKCVTPPSYLKKTVASPLSGFGFLNGSIKVIVKDLSLAEDAKSLVEEVLSDSAKVGYGVDVLVNNAGMFVEGSAAAGDVDLWSTALHVNLLSPMIITRMLSEKMKARKGGVIINIGSIAGLEAMTFGGVYSTTKFGLRGWSLHCGRNLKEDNIKVTLISPGYVHTDMVKMAKIDFSKVIQPNDIAEAALLPIRTSYSCCPEEITIRVTGNCSL